MIRQNFAGTLPRLALIGGLTLPPLIRSLSLSAATRTLTAAVVACERPREARHHFADQLDTHLWRNSRAAGPYQVRGEIAEQKVLLKEVFRDRGWGERSDARSGQGHHRVLRLPARLSEHRGSGRVQQCPALFGEANRVAPQKRRGGGPRGAGRRPLQGQALQPQ